MRVVWNSGMAEKEIGIMNIGMMECWESLRHGFPTYSNVPDLPFDFQHSSP